MIELCRQKKRLGIGQEKELIKLAVESLFVNDKSVDSTNLQSELDNIAGIEETHVTENFSYLNVKYKDSQRTYKVDKYGNIAIIKDYDSSPSDLAGTGTKEDPFKIESIEDLITFLIMLNGGNTSLGIESTNFNNQYINLTRHFDCTNDNSYADPNTKRFSEFLGNKDMTLKEILLSDEYGFFRSNWDSEFNGVLNGEGNTIGGINYEPTSNKSSMINKNNGTIENININYKYDTQTNNISGLVSENLGTIKKCNINIEINAISLIGGIVKTNSGIIEYCNTYGNINAPGNDIGVITLKNTEDGIIRYCSNNANIKGSKGGYSFGGIASTNNGLIEECFNKGTITEQYQVIGGITGNNNGIIKNCYNTAELKGSWYIGGITGGVGANAQIINCYNIGKITSNSSYGTGGLVGNVTVCNNIYNLVCLTGAFSKLAQWTLNETCSFQNEDYFKSQAILDILNKDMPSNTWVKDNTNINNGYPILHWEINE